MRRSRRPIVIASRRSALARAQAQAVGAALGRLNPHVTVEYRWVESEGDRRTDVALAEAGGKGLFAKAVEAVLAAGDADLAVHSLKDLPAKATRGLILAAITRREDPRDCLIARHGERRIEELVGGAVIGTAGPRRAAQVLRLRPDLKIKLLRGNVETRVRKVLEPVVGTTPLYSATLMAVAGLRRAGLSQHAKNVLEPEVILPAAGQGALALQCRGDDHLTIRRLLPLNDPPTSQAVAMERAVVAGLHGDCHSPIAAYAEPVTVGGEPGFRLRARVLSPDGRQCAEAAAQATGRGVGRLARDVLKKLKAKGAEEILEQAMATVVASGR